jgi:uncharacterized surface anchored protein
MKETWVSDTNGVHTFTVSPGTYRLVETVVPEGYNTPAETTIEFNVTSEGKVYQAGQAVENSQDKPFVLTNTLGTTDVNISKQDSAGAELPGAQMKLTDASGTVIEQWESGTAPHKVTVNKGTAGNPAQYALHEEAAPNGYDVATDITFYVSSDGTVTQGTTKLESNAPVVMEDFALSEEHTVSLSKQDSAGNELSGATIELRDALGDVVESWVSDGSNHQVKVGPGTYTMVETAAPEGYEIATEITFTVAKDGTVTKDGETVAGNAPIVMVDNYATTSQDTNTPVPENPEDEPTNPDSEATAPEEPENGGEEVAPSEETANPEDQEAASEEAPESEEVPESEEATSTEGASETAQTGDAILPVAAVILVAAVGFVVALIARKRAGKRN